jgi:glycosyltransferase involved in cell wall biosynthesis
VEDSLKIHLALITYNRLEYTRLALASVLADPTEQFSLTLWDNASSDGTREFLSGIDDPRIDRIVLSDRNVGQTAAVNEVWAKSKADLVGKLDNDCIVTPGWTRTLAVAHKDIPRLGVVACWHYFADDFVYERAKRKIYRFGDHQILRHPWTCGTGLLVKRSTYADLGPIQDKATTQYWITMARQGYINGFYYPLVLQEHMDDPKSKHSHLKDEESYQAAKAVTFNINRHGQDTLADRWRWRQEVLNNLLTGPWHPKHYTGWRAKFSRAVRRVRTVAAGRSS